MEKATLFQISMKYLKQFLSTLKDKVHIKAINQSSICKFV